MYYSLYLDTRLLLLKGKTLVNSLARMIDRPLITANKPSYSPILFLLFSVLYGQSYRVNQ